jgi:cytochrome c
MRSVRIAVAGGLLATVALAAADRGTPDEAKAMLEKAAEHYKSAGRTQALADFSAGKPPFKDRDLYVVCIGADHKIAANGAFPQYVGVSADLLKDAAGKPLAAAILASASGSGSVDYPMINPQTHAVEPKVIFTRKLGDDVCGVGAYKAP